METLKVKKTATVVEFEYQSITYRWRRPHGEPAEDHFEAREAYTGNWTPIGLLPDNRTHEPAELRNALGDLPGSPWEPAE